MYEQFKGILVTSFQADPAQVRPEATLTDLGLDSLDLVELAIVIKTDFGVVVTDDELVDLARVDAVVDAIGNKKAAAV